MNVTLRAQQPDDLPLLPGGDSIFDDFGPRGIQDGPRPSRLDGDGALTVVVDGQAGDGQEGDGQAGDGQEGDGQAGDGQVAGGVGWHWQQWGPTAGSRCPMIGIWLRPEYRGRGIGTAAQAQLADLLFRHTTANRVEAHTETGNIAEQKALEAAGFRREGVTRGSTWRDGAYRDGVLYAVLRDDPRPGRGAPHA